MNRLHSKCHSNRFKFVFSLTRDLNIELNFPYDSFIHLESAISSDGCRLWSNRNIRTHRKSHPRLQCYWDRITSLVGYACITTTTHCTMAFFERSGGWQTIINDNFNCFCLVILSILCNIKILIHFFFSSSHCCCCCLSVVFFLIVKTD